MFDGAHCTSATAGGCRKAGEKGMPEQRLKLGHRMEQASGGSQLLFSPRATELPRGNRSRKSMNLGSGVTVQDEIDGATQRRVERP